MAPVEGRKHDIRQCRFTRMDTLLLTFRVSRFLGIAPVALRSDRTGSSISTSRQATLYSYLLIGILHFCIVAGVALDLHQEKRHALRVRGASSSAAFIIEIILIMFITTVGCYTAPNRMKNVARFLEAIHEINSGIECNHGSKSCKLSYFGNLLFILSNVVIFMANYYDLCLESLYYQSDWRVPGLYTAIFLEFLVMMCLQLQFLWLAMVVADCIRSVNTALEQLLLLTDKQLSNKEVAQRVRRLMLCYGTICDIVAGINNSFGWLLVFFIFSFIWHFVFTPYFLLVFLKDKHKNVNRLIHQIIVFIFHFIYMMVIIEPGYITEVQAKRTHTLVKQVTQRVRCPEEPIAAELEVFLKQIHLNQLAYRPQRMCTITRRLIAIILGGSTTYLVIILQFQLLDTAEW